ncbi:ferric-dicitrate binding protein FerR (iron transport regulator) [Rhabdobacter roseus]|uniref:Ferric-dicitrate binding protein FerR (Iron transport regulator) n=1 Tax=Rhabdobacter roseus TaxID=1655419 RepID=A0A840THH6_9BACT|nr:FecR domain-containing protein [Rhabdobacter roseus]MBB5283606.1 ferric-dicitrate binding protein FerR (iron transport regulator) [Rhabdobacter roseus]
MSDYTSYRAEDFVFDETFRQWVLFQENEAFWQSWLTLYPERAVELAQARYLVLQLRVKEKPLSEAAVQAYLARIQSEIAQLPAEAAWWQSTRQVPMYRTWVAAAMVLVVLGLVAWLLLLRPTELAYQTAYGEVRRVELPDGSVATLNANSTLRLTAWKPGQERKVQLEGEAFFEVQHLGPQQTFVVETTDLAVEVVGTSFNVASRDEGTQVVLNTGQTRVKVPAHEALDMKPNDLIALNRKTRQLTRQTVQADHYSSWRNYQLVFESTPVREILQRVEDTYGLRVLLPDTTLANRRLSGTVPSQDYRVLLATVATLLNAHLVENPDHSLEIRPNP